MSPPARPDPVTPLRNAAAMVLAAAIAACGDRPSGQASGTTDTLSNGAIRTIADIGSGWADEEGWRLEVERVIQPPDEEAVSLSRIRQIVVLSGGDVLAVDGNPERILIFPASQAEPARIFARPGSGPGEVAEPKVALFGDTVVVHSPPNARLSRFTVSGELLGESPITTSQAGPAISVDNSGRLWVVDTDRRGDAPLSQQWIRYDLSGNRLDSIGMPVAVAPLTWRIPSAVFTIPYSPSTQRLVMWDGNILYGSTASDEFVISSTGTDTILVFGRSGAVPHSVSDSDRDNAYSRYQQMSQLADMINRSDIPSVKPLWLGLHQDRHGSIWVHRRPSDPDGRGTEFDVYDPAGRYRGAVAAPFTSTTLGWSGDRLAVADEDLDGFPRITVYRIVRPAGPRRPA